ncbi:hypothetical protein EOL96_05990 [Candidatus Saccharibacteria bacterium]|nr:hypothetical protein [Candidatus Saccharibacteria bacterium]
MKKISRILFCVLACCALNGGIAQAEVASTYSHIPPFLTNAMPPMVMLTMARDHRLYYEAYNDASDINGDGVLDVRYNPNIDYYGYFDSYKYYEFSSANDRFEPRGTTTTKKAPSGNYWSGDFLNYVSMTRMDCLRKVLYGGYRSTDTATETVLERAYIPQDAHSFGKEYDSIAHDGYDIREYTPLDLPVSGTRHLIATTALGTDGKPLLRVLNDSTARIWEWVATERPVVKSNFGGTTAHPGHPADHAAFETMVATYATSTRKFGSLTSDTLTINGAGNPFGNDDNYLTIFSGNLTIDDSGDYWFAVDGDDAVEVLIDGVFVVGWYGGHGKCGCTTHNAKVSGLTAGVHSIEFRQEEASGDDNYYLYWLRPDAKSYEIVPAYTAKKPRGLSNMTHTTYNLVSTATITDYTLRVQVGVSSMPESNCKQYANGTYKPIGVLQRHGESDRMLFGLMTGSYTKNLSGGVLRQPIESIKQEINTSTGEFLYKDSASVGGIVKTLDLLRIHGFRNDANFDYNENCGWITTAPLSEGQCRMWGSPMAEMMYETVRYFAGASAPINEFTYTYNSNPTATTLDDNQLGLPLPSWNNPYNATNYCAKPIMIAISDIFPSYDSDQLPGSAWPVPITSSNSSSASLSGLDVNSRVQGIANEEGVNGSVFIGQNGAPHLTGYDGACTPKNIPGFETIRGLCPEEPSKQGSYYSSAVTHYAATTDLSSVDTNQTMASYMVALSSPLPEIRIPVAGKIVTMVPFGKSVGGSSISAAAGSFQPTNTIVDFFVEDITPTTGTFRVNFEDVEQGADHDMDAIVRYHYEVMNNSTVTVTLTSEYAAGGVIQHMGYIISGTTSDGTYLVVRDKDTSEDSDPDYHLDKPNTSDALPLADTRSFTAGTTAAASLLTNPLWFAAKWGGFEDSNGNGKPDLQSEWDKDNNGVPDTYFFVANPTKLEEQLNNAFADILRRTSSGAAAAVVAQSSEREGAIYQSIFFPETENKGGIDPINWIGQVQVLFIDNHGNIREDTNSNFKLDISDSNPSKEMNANDKIISYIGSDIYRYQDLDGNLELDPSEKNSTFELVKDPQDIKYLWTSTPWLSAMSNSEAVVQRSAYNATTNNRYIVTFADKDNDMIVDSGEIQDFVWPPTPTPNSGLNATTDFYAYLTLYPSFENTPSDLGNLRDNDTSGFASVLAALARRQIDYIRGVDQGSETVAGYALNATRSRLYSDNGTNHTWRLGDVVHSAPTVVGKPSQNYHLLYEDDSYLDFFRKYRSRRQVVYVGANDGMLHAFNAGFYNSTKKGFDVTHSGEVAFDLGTEMWAYVPYNLLPHLLWLSDLNYGRQLHVSYMDLKPLVFDARIFPADSDHPGGWGTVLVAGMRLGGGEIRADLDKSDGNNFIPGTDRTMSSAYVVVDITNPEDTPRFLAEIKMPELGFTTCYPAVMPMTTPNSATATGNQWYLVFGSGPADASGKADPGKLNVERSDQRGHLYVLDLKALATEKKVVTLDSSGQFLEGNATFALTEPGSFISDPVAVDLDIGSTNASALFKTDLVYYGTVAGDQTYGLGTMRRLVTNNAMPSAGTVSWVGNSTLIDVQQPVTVPPSLAMDTTGRLWVYFGTGRFFNRDDIPQSQTMTFYGVKEPGTYSSGVWDYSWDSASVSGLYNSTTISLQGDHCSGGKYTEDCVDVYKSGAIMSGGWSALLADVAAASGWRHDMPLPLERVLNKSTVYGGATIFTSYLPPTDPCMIEGQSSLWALYYMTGTAYFDPIFPGSSDDFATHISLGKGLAFAPKIYETVVGPTVLTPTSEGSILIDTPNIPIKKNPLIFWLKRQE